jgi:hypothetical protein
MDKRHRTASLRMGGEARPSLVSSLPVIGVRSAPGSPESGSPVNSRPGSPTPNGKPVTLVKKLQLEAGVNSPKSPADKLSARIRRSSSITLGSPLPMVKHSVETDYNLLEVIGQGMPLFSSNLVRRHIRYYSPLMRCIIAWFAIYKCQIDCCLGCFIWVRICVTC